MKPIYTFRPNRKGKGYDITLINDFFAYSTVATRVEAEARVGALNKNARRPAIEKTLINLPSSKRYKPQLGKFERQVRQTITAKELIEHGKTKEFMKIRAKQIGCSVGYLYRRMRELR